MTLTISPATLARAPRALEDTWFTASVTILGISHRLDAIAVREDETGLQRALDPDLDEFLQHYLAAADAEHFSTVHLVRREYVLVLTPLAD